MRLPPEPDVVSSYSTNSVREQLRQVNQRIDEVQRDFVRSKEEVGETTKDGSPFALEILDKPILSSFQLPALAPYDGSTDPTEHVTAFRAQMALYDTSEALMERRATSSIRQQILDGDPEDARHSSHSGNPSIPHGTSTLTVLLVINREAPVHSARNVAAGEPVCFVESLVAGKREDHKKS
ncbi:hypothetical protein GW17_00015150 [Ensete ventricosum]|nr:hypothetical protein GW17_00015150 [Ensete ventricosum]